MEVPALSWLLVMFGGACALSLVLTYWVRRVALRLGLVDVPDGERRVHFLAVPRVGGVAIFLTLALMAAVRVVAGGAALPPALARSLMVLYAGTAAVFLVGLWDDVVRLTAARKFLLELLISTAVFAAGVRLRSVGIGHGQVWVFPLGLSYLVTTVWLVGVTNAFNLIDGSDGVAAGAAVFASGSLAAVMLFGGNLVGAAVAFTVMGATLGFLFYNFPPASIFLGDSGSLTLGFVLAVLGIITTSATPTALAVAIPVVSFGLPILDTALAMARRFLRGERMFTPDRGHIHHRLRDLGHSPRRVALLMYLACAGFALLSLLLLNENGGPVTGTVFFVAGVVVLVAVQRLNIPELLELRRVFQRGLMQRAVIGSNVRIRDAARRVHEACHADQIFESLAGAFLAGRFERAELWLGDDLHGETPANGRMERVDGGILWRWSARGPNGVPPAGEPEDAWELRLPLRDAHGQITGRLSLWHSLENGELLPDVRLILLELGPQVHAAVRRLHGPAEAEAPPLGAREAPVVLPTAQRMRRPLFSRKWV